MGWCSVVWVTYISIHAPREGGDGRTDLREVPCIRISIHAPREGGDSVTKAMHKINASFQSTPPARGATLSARLSKSRSS